MRFRLSARTKGQTGRPVVGFPVAVALAAAVCCAAVLTAVNAPAGDWPHWRGARLNGVSDEPLPVEQWPSGKGALLWRTERLQPLTPPVMARLGNFDSVFVLARHQPGTADEGVQVVSVDAEEGSVNWRLPLPVYLCDLPADGSLQGLTLDPSTHNLAVLTPAGWLGWLDGVTGGVLWWRSLREEFGWRAVASRTVSGPLVDEVLVLVSGVSVDVVGRRWLSVWAFDKRNGELVWQRRLGQAAAGVVPTGPVVTVAGGQRTLLVAGAATLYALQVRTGRLLWTQRLSKPSGVSAKRAAPSRSEPNRQQACPPVAVGSFVVAGYARLRPGGTPVGRLVAVDAATRAADGSPSLLWQVDLAVGRCAPLLVDGRVYAVDDGGTLVAVELQTGRVLGRWSLGAPVVGGLVFASHRLVACTTAGRWFVFEPTEQGLTKVAQSELAARPVGPPLVSRGRVVLATEQGLECVGRADMRLPPTSPPWLVEPSVSEDPEPATVQLVPAQRWVRSGSAEQRGERLQLQVRLFNSRGQFLQLARPDGTVRLQHRGPGRLVPPATYVSPDQPTHGAATVLARLLGGAPSGTRPSTPPEPGSTSVARIGLVPRLPWRFDFTDGRVPASWSVVREAVWRERAAPPSGLARQPTVGSTQDSGPALLVTDQAAPDGAFECFFGPADLTDYTVGCDVLVVGSPEEAGDAARANEVSGGGRAEESRDAERARSMPAAAGGSRDGQTRKTSSAEKRNHAGPAADVGVIGQRYRLELRGRGKLAVVSWSAVRSKVRSVPFSWRPGVWYRLKLRTSVEQLTQGTTAVVKAKAWRRDEREPAEWQLVWKDRPANEHGSPGLFARPRGCRVYFDNVFVVANSDEPVDK